MISFNPKNIVFRFVLYMLGAIAIIMLWLCLIATCKAQSAPFVRVQHDSFVSYYDIDHHNPAMVVYPLEYAHFAGAQKVSGRHFKADTKLPRPRVLDKDYSNTGYVRGHLVSAGDRDSNKKWLKETYLTSNLVPMTMVFNSGPWKMVEDSIRSLAIAGHRLLVVKGCLYSQSPRCLEQVIQNRLCITIPDGFFCHAVCLDCGYRSTSQVRNTSGSDLINVLQVGSRGLENVLQYERDSRISMLLQNILGLWSREEYEIITR